MEFSFSAEDPLGNLVSEFVGCTSIEGELVTSPSEDGRADFSIDAGEVARSYNFDFGVLPMSDEPSEGPIDCSDAEGGTGELEIVAGPFVQLDELSERHDFPVDSNWIQVAAIARDEHRNGVAEQEVRLTWENDDGDTLEQNATTDWEGVVQFTVELDRTKSRVITVSSGEHSFSLLVQSVAPWRLERFVIGASDCVSPGVFPPVEIGDEVTLPIVACDNFGEPTAGNATVAVFSGGTGTSVINSIDDEDGVQTVTITVGTFAGDHWITASMDDGSLSDRLDFVVPAGPPRYLDYVSGDGQTGVLNRTFADPFIVRLTDAYDNPVPNEDVVWTAEGVLLRSSVHGTGLASITSTTTHLGRSRVWGIPSAETATITASYETGDGSLEHEFLFDSIVEGLGQVLTVYAGAGRLPAYEAGSFPVEAHYDAAPTVAESVTSTELVASAQVESEFLGRTWRISFDALVPPGSYDFALDFDGTVTNTIELGFGQLGSPCEEVADCDSGLACTEGYCVDDDWRAVPTLFAEFTMGSNDPRSADLDGATHSPAHPVSLSFDIIAETTEVTRAEWSAVTGETFVECSDCPVTSASWIEAVDFLNRSSLRDGLDECYTLHNCTDFDNPATCDRVTWDWSCSGYRLPTEAEWEFLARAGTEDQPWPCGTDPVCLAEEANCDSSVAIEVGSLQPSEYGLYDMIGNASEWVWDHYLAYEGSDIPREDPRYTGTVPFDERVARGQACGRVYWRYRRDAGNEGANRAGFRAVSTRHTALWSPGLD